MKKIRNIYTRIGLLLGSVVYFSAALQGQTPNKGNTSVAVSPMKLSTTSILHVTIHNKGEDIRTHGTFPEIEGFTKQGTSQSMKMQLIGGHSEVTHSLTQHYRPKRAGQYRVPAFRIQVNDKVVTHPAFDIRVVTGQSVPHKPSLSQGQSPFDMFFDDFNNPAPTDETFVDVKDDAFLSLHTDKKEAFLGEGVTATLSFYVSANNLSLLQFDNLSEQLSDIINQLKPTGCWEESFRIQNIQRKRVQLQGKPYYRFVLYKSVLYPLRHVPMTFAPVGLQMIKHKVSRSLSFWGRRTQPSHKTFYTKKENSQSQSLASSSFARTSSCWCLSPYAPAKKPPSANRRRI